MNSSVKTSLSRSQQHLRCLYAFLYVPDKTSSLSYDMRKAIMGVPILRQHNQKVKSFMGHANEMKNGKPSKMADASLFTERSSVRTAVNSSRCRLFCAIRSDSFLSIFSSSCCSLSAKLALDWTFIYK